MQETIEKTPGSSIIPGLRYKDAHAAIAWLQRVLGLTAQAVFEDANGAVEHAQLTLGRGMIMLGSVREGGSQAYMRVQPEAIGGRVTGTLYMHVADAEPVYAAAREAGTPITMELQTMPYGGKAFACLDPEGFMSSVGEYDPWA